MGFWLSRSLSYELFLFSRWNLGHHGAFHTNFFFFHDGILAIRKPFRRALLFSRWNSGYQEAFARPLSFFTMDGYHEAFSRTLSFFTMESWPSRSLSHKLFLFSRWNSGYQEAFHLNSFFFHDGISAITKPFHEFFSHMVESRLSRSLFTNFSFTLWNLGYHEAFSRIFLSHGGIHKMHDLGEEYFHIYHTEYLHRIRLVKNLAS
jgi:hypothetical protein